MRWTDWWISHDLAYRLLAELRIKLYQLLDPLAPAYLVRRRSGDLVSALAAADAEGTGSALSPGDFVRWCRQVLDLLDQVRNAAPQPELRTTAKRAIDAIRRGVVAVDAG